MNLSVEKPLNSHLVGTALAIGFWLWLAYHQVMTAVHSLNPVPLLLGLESLFVGIFLLWRKPETPNPHPWYRRLLILCLAMMVPLVIEVENPANPWVLGFSCLGLLLTLWALISLGRSFGLAPADRGLVTHGPYRYLRHPMYAGAMLNMLAVVLANLSLPNLLILALTIGVDVYRITLEERTVTAYADYAGQVRWRLLPWIW